MMDENSNLHVDRIEKSPQVTPLILITLYLLLQSVQPQSSRVGSGVGSGAFEIIELAVDDIRLVTFEIHFNSSHLRNH